jgi:hypothetical protein
VTLQKNGKNPTFQYMKDRQWGMTPGKCRQVRLDDDQICVYWRPK